MSSDFRPDSSKMWQHELLIFLRKSTQNDSENMLPILYSQVIVNCMLLIFGDPHASEVN